MQNFEGMNLSQLMSQQEGTQQQVGGQPLVANIDAAISQPIIGSTGGMVIENKVVETEEAKEYGEYEKYRINGPGAPASDSLMEYMKEMDESIEEAKALAEEAKEEEDDEEEMEDDEDDEEIEEDFEEKYTEAIVVIDKSGMGSVIDFTDDERAKLEKVKKIKLEEIETISLNTIKKKKAKKKQLDKVLERTNSLHRTQIVLPASGYTAVMRGCTTYELVSLVRDTQNLLLDTEAKWTLIHSKVEETSIGKMDFDTFLANTAAIDYPIFIYGILCATYPEEDKMPLKCTKCSKEFEHSYTVKSLIRAEKMDEELRENIARIVDGSHLTTTAKLVHEESAVNVTKTIKLPVSGYIVELHVQSSKDFIYSSIKELAANKDDKYSQASVLSSLVNAIYIRDLDADDEEYFEYTTPVEISKIIFALKDTDILVLTKQGESILENLGIEFGLMDINCPHCKHHTNTVTMDLESILFYKYQQALTTQID